MNKNLLLKLLAHAHRSVAEVKSSVPDLFAALQGLALDEARDKLKAEFTDAAKAIKGQFARVVKGSHTVVVGTAGGLGPEAPQVGGVVALDQGKLVDVRFYVEYSVMTS